MLRARFAPSPTGEMHLGNARTALLAWLQARVAKGYFILRLEDLDSSRIRPGAAEQILRDLAWLGLDWDEGWDIGGDFAPYTQSERLELYAQYAAKLETYACSCSRKDIQNAVSAPHAGELRYPGTCRNAPTHPERPLALRVRVPDLEIEFLDGICGAVRENVQATVGDFVIRRNDGAWAYQLACVADDIEMRISHVLRGADLLSSTARQLVLYKALGQPAPRFFHAPLLTDFAGQRLAKRNQALSLRALRESGKTSNQVLLELAQSLGWNINQPCKPTDLLEHFGVWIHQFDVSSG
ncbi:MAG: tRNA glutamyl-Q(34) synthetase GluQRS [Deinococcales bacterium]